MRLLFFASQVLNFCSDGLSDLENSTLRAPQKYSSKSRLNLATPPPCAGRSEHGNNLFFRHDSVLARQRAYHLPARLKASLATKVGTAMPCPYDPDPPPPRPGAGSTFTLDGQLRRAACNDNDAAPLGNPRWRLRALLGARSNKMLDSFSAFRFGGIWECCLKL
jgi:hypothetical protein